MCVDTFGTAWYSLVEYACGKGPLGLPEALEDVCLVVRRREEECNAGCRLGCDFQISLELTGLFTHLLTNAIHGTCAAAPSVEMTLSRDPPTPPYHYSAQIDKHGIRWDRGDFSCSLTPEIP